MTWKYLPVLNTCIQILVTIGLGSILGFFRIFNAAFVPQAVRFVFYVALPCLIIRGVGIYTDLYKKDIWKYVVAFLILRVIALIFSVITTKINKRNQGNVGIGDVAVKWLSLTWISTVILGIPITTAVFGDPALGGRLGIMAGISSFIFQLPLQLFFLECHAFEKEQESQTAAENPDIESNLELEMEKSDINEQNTADLSPVSTEPRGLNDGDTDQDNTLDLGATTAHEVEVRTKGIRYSQVFWKIWLKVFHNPVLWGLFIAFIISLSKVGKTYLHPEGSHYVAGLGWIETTLDWLGKCVSPVSLFAMGVWMQNKGKKLIVIGPLELSLYMLSKLIVVPLIMVGLARAFDFDDTTGRAAVLIASLPISLASFTLGSNYKIGEAVLSSNVAVGTILLLPTIIIWNVIMDKLGLFPLSST